MTNDEIRKKPESETSGKKLFTVRCELERSADFQSAVSPNSIRHNVEPVSRADIPQRLAECNSEVQRSAAGPQPNTPSPPCNGGEGWGEEGPELCKLGRPSPRSSPHSCVAGRGRGKGRAGRLRNNSVMWTSSLSRRALFLRRQLTLLRLSSLVCILSDSAFAGSAPSTDPADFTVWPNQASHANGDRWLVEHHDQIRRMLPNSRVTI